MTRPIWSRVASLYSLTNWPMFTPCWPSAGPTGGAGVAWPAGIWSLTSALTSFLAPPLAGAPLPAPGFAGAAAMCLPRASASGGLHPPVLQFDRGLAAEGRHDDAHEAPGVVPLL